MVVSQKHKYIFIGLPCSGSSAISKELIECYQGKSILNKHTNYPILKIKSDLNLEDYFVFAVYRDPIEISFSRFTKIKYDEKDRYTNPKYFKENGGNVGKNLRLLREKMVNQDWTFEEYLKNQSKGFIPYDNNFSFNKKYLSFVIQFESLAQDFYNALRKIGIEPKRSLPHYNKTEKKLKDTPKISNKLKNRMFAPYLCDHSKVIEGNLDCEPNNVSMLTYYFLKPVHYIRMIVKDLNRSHSNDSYFSQLDQNKKLT